MTVGVHQNGRRSVGALLRDLAGGSAELVRGAGGCEEGIPEALGGAAWPKFRPDGLWFVHAGGTAGRFGDTGSSSRRG